MISDRLFKVKIPTIATYTDAELEVYGIGLDNYGGDIKHDSYNDFSVVHITIDRMVTLYTEGYPLYILDQKESTEIFTILEDYLHKRNQFALHSPNRQTDSEDRLEDIDTFASEIFGYNKKTIVKGTVGDSSGYDLGINLMGFKNQKLTETNVQVTNRYGGVVSGEGVPVTQHSTGYTYGNNILPELDYDEIKRKSLLNHDRF